MRFCSARRAGGPLPRLRQTRDSFAGGGAECADLGPLEAPPGVGERSDGPTAHPRRPSNLYRRGRKPRRILGSKMPSLVAAAPRPRAARAMMAPRRGTAGRAAGLAVPARLGRDGRDGCAGWALDGGHGQVRTPLSRLRPDPRPGGGRRRGAGQHGAQRRRARLQPAADQGQRHRRQRSPDVGRARCARRDVPVSAIPWQGDASVARRPPPRGGTAGLTWLLLLQMLAVVESKFQLVVDQFEIRATPFRPGAQKTIPTDVPGDWRKGCDAHNDSCKVRGPGCGSGSMRARARDPSPLASARALAHWRPAARRSRRRCTAS
jgi:hypothetical protein